MWAERAPHRCVAISPFSVVLCLSPYSAAASQPASRARQAAWFYMCYVTPASSSSPPPLVIRHGFISVAGMRGKSKVCSPKHSTPRSACGGEARQHAGCACWAGRPTSPSAGAMPSSPCRTGWARARVRAGLRFRGQPQGLFCGVCVSGRTRAGLRRKDSGGTPASAPPPDEREPPRLSAFRRLRFMIK